MDSESRASGFTEPIAIVGTSCRFPGAADHPEGLWNVLSKGLSGWSREANDRFSMAAFYHPSPEISGAFNTRGLYLLKQDISHFDNQFFNISPMEAKAIDPQQRLMLELAYEAFENAGMTTESLSSSETGVYCAVTNHDYETMQCRDPESSSSYRFTGTGPALVANRVSYAFDLSGPSITLDTGCSGSLVALHEACKAIRTGDIKQALVGGTNLILDPEQISVMSSLRVLSDHGRCYTFDSRAGGFGRGEGVAAIVLKTLNEAVRDGDPIRAVIRGSSVNSDGRTPGLTMPSQAAQVAMMRKAYREAGIDPRETCYVEAHGTGTKVGDKIESAAIAEVFCPDRSETSPLYVGSVKTNIGHLESTAGLAGVLKTVLMLEKGMIPPNLNFSHASDTIPLEALHINIPQTLQPWPTMAIQRGSVNSFGYGGTNAHVILDAYSPRRDSATCDGIEGDATKDATDAIGLEGSAHKSSFNQRLFVLTHDNQNGLGRSASNLKQYVQQMQPNDSNVLADLSYTLSMRRSRFPNRVAVRASDQESLLEALNDFSTGSISPQRAIEHPKICFVFTGQGAQWACMGKELLHTYPVYAEAMAKADLHLKQLGAPWSLLTELHKDQNDSRINEASISQPCCTAIQIALVDLLKVWNIRPQAVCGHSSGEIAAAYAAGFISAEDALKISYYRGQSVANLKLKPKLDGIMLAAGLSASKALEYISRATPRSPLSKAVVACINSNASVTISGDRNAIQKVQSLLEADGIFNRLLVVDVAYHSHHMELVQDDYLTALNGVRPIKSDSQIHMVSSVTGKEIGSDSLDAGYWVRNMLSPVRFSEALEGAVCMSTSATDHPLADIILEIGPHSALAGPIKQVLHAQGHNHSKIWYNSVLSRNANAVASALDMAGGLFSRGVSINFNAVNDPIDAAKRNVLTDLPTYSWQHTMSHWHESRASIQYRLRKFARHDLLGVPCHDSLSIEPTWRISLRLSEMPWLKGHVLDNQVIFPAAGHICMALEALRQTVLGQGRMWKNLICRFRNVVIDRALLIPDNTSGVETFFSLRQYAPSFREAASNWKEFRIFSMSEKAEAVEHCRGLVCVEDLGTTNVIEGERENLRETDLLRSTFQEAQRNCRKIVDPARFYNDLREIGISYTDSFASLTQIRSRPLASLCTIEIPDTKVSMPAEYEQSHFMHPATLDTCFQAVFPAMMEANLVSSSFVLTAIEAMEFSSDLSSVAGTRLLAYSTVEPFGRSKFWTEVTVGNPDLTQPSLVRIKGLQFTSMDAQSNSAEEWDEYKLCHVFDWSLDTASATSQDLYQLCHTGLSETSARERREAYDCYCQFIMQKVLSTIKSEDDVSTQPHLRKFFQWIRANSVSIAKVADPALRNRVASLGIEGRTLVHVGDHLVEILKGEVEPLTVLMKDDLLYQVYSAEEVERCNIQLANYVRQLQFKNPQMRILEIGAGTAGTTLSVLAALTTDCYGNRVTPDKVQEYVFTDISSGFFEKAKDKLGLFGELVKFKKLDIEQPPSEQGFVEGSFDLIIASNVLHATQSLTKTLHNVCRLLKPGGKLGLIEVTAPQVLWPMIMGTLPGWWLGADDGRVSSPLINVSGWNEALRRSGFSGVDAALKDYEVDYEHQVSLIISTATPKRKTSQIQQVRILVDDNSRNVANAFQSLIGTSAGGSIIQQDCVQASISSEAIYVVLLEVVQSFLASCTASEFLKIKEVLLQSKGVLWVTKGAAIESESPQKAVITGLSRTIRSEDPTSNILTLDLDPSNDDPTYMAQQILKVYNQAFGPHSKEFLNEFEYAVRDGKVLIPRICADRNIGDYIRRSVGEQKMQIASLAQPGRALGLEIETPGLLESFYWADSKHHSRPPTANEVQVQMGMFALNFKDVMNAMGQLEGLSEMLIESSGVVVKVGEEVQDRFRIGDRVCALGTKGLATFSNLDYHLVQRIPDDMPLELASSILVSYATALYALRDMAHLNKGESVLIHSGAGALGQAAIALAQYMNAGDIFVTVSSAEKKDLIMQRFRIPEENIYSSRSLSFGSGIRRQTDGKGVDVIINSLSGDAARESQTCLAQFGRFIEVGKKDLLSNARMETRYLEKNSVFAAVDLTMVALHRPLEMQALLKTVIDLVHTRAVQTLGPITVMSVTELENAFRLMQKGRHIGKIVLKLDEHAQVRVQPIRPTLPKLSTDSTYLIVGGLGGLGRATIRHLVQLGAKHIATLSRSGANSAAKRTFIKEMHDGGVNLMIHQGSAGNVEDVRKVKEAAGKRPVRGVVQGAMALHDTSFENMTHDQWCASLEPKVAGTLNLDKEFGDSLDFFIVMSSGCGIIGARGQGNYAAASTFQDAFARHRASKSLPIRTIDLGVIASEGYTAENQSAAAHVMKQGLRKVPLKYVFPLLSEAISNPIPSQVSDAQVSIGLQRIDLAANSEHGIADHTDSKFSHIGTATLSKERSKEKTGEIDICTALQNAAGHDIVIDLVQAALTTKLSRLLAMPVEELCSHRSVSSYGTDSLVAVELRNWTRKQLGAQLQTFELMSSLSIRDVAGLIAERSTLVPVKG